MNTYLSRFYAFLQYFGSTLFVSILQVLINPLIALNLSPNDYAIIGYYTSFNILFTPLITFFLTNYFIKCFFQVDNDKRKKIKATIMQMLIYGSFILSVLSLIVIFVYQSYFNEKSDIPFSPYAFLTIISIFLTGVYSLKLAEFRLERKANQFALYTIVAGLISVALVLIIVVYLKEGAVGRLWATLLGNLVMFLLVIFKERSCFKVKIEKSIFIDIVNFCWPLTIAGMLGFFSSGYDRVLLERAGDYHELGFYSVGVQIAAYLTIFSNAVNSTFQPDLYECYAKKNFKRLFFFILIIVGSISVIVLSFIAVAPWVVDLLTAGRYTDAALFARILALSSITAALYYSTSQITIAMGYSKMLLAVRAIGSLLSIVAFYYLIEYFGAIGAAYGNVASYLIFLVINVAFLLIFKKKQLIKK